jgi:cation transporter-like permease
MRARRHWFLIAPVVLMALGIIGVLVSRALGMAWTAPVAVLLPNLLLGLLILGVVVWVVLVATNRNAR